MSNTLQESIKSWVSLDNRIKLLNEEMKELKSQKKDYEDSMQDWAQKQIDSGLRPAVKISDGKIRFVETKQTSPLTLKYIESCLNALFNENNAKVVLEYIKKNRESKVVTEIKRTYDKDKSE